MRKRPKQSFTLLEVSIAVAIAGILLSGLWNLYYRWYKSFDKIRILQDETHRMLFAYCRFQKLSERMAATRKGAFAYRIPGEERVCFGYEGEIDPDPVFNGFLYGLLYKDGKDRLCYTEYAPDGTNRTEMWLDKVSVFEFSFSDEKGENRKEGGKGDSLPLKMTVLVETKDGKQEEIPLRLKNPKDPIFYRDPFYRGGEE